MIVTWVSVVEAKPLTAIAPPPLPKFGPAAELPEKVEFSTASVPRQMLIAPPRAVPSPTARLPTKVLRATATWMLVDWPGSMSIAPPYCSTLPSNVVSVTTSEPSASCCAPRAATVGSEG